METKTKAFDAVAESRKLNAMSQTERIAYLDALGQRVRAELRPKKAL